MNLNWVIPAEEREKNWKLYRIPQGVFPQGIRFFILATDKERHEKSREHRVESREKGRSRENLSTLYLLLATLIKSVAE